MTSTTGPGPAGRPLRRDAALNRDRILKAAGDVFAERGLDASLGEIADRAGLGVGTIYRRFPDKEALIAALLAEKRGAARAVAEEARGQPTGWKAFCALLEGLIALLTTDRAVQELMLSDVGSEVPSRSVADLRPAGEEILRRAKEEGTLRPDVEFNDLPAVLCMLSAVADLTSAEGEDRWKRYLQVVLSGLRAGPADDALPGAALSAAELDHATELYASKQRSRRRPL